MTADSFPKAQLSPRFSRVEYWLLESVVLARLPVGILLDPELESALNKRGHGAGRSMLIEAVVALHQRGLLTGYCRGSADASISRQALEKALDRPRRPPFDDELCYALTPKGGRQWESFAAPDWSRFVNEWSEVKDDVEEVTIVASDRAKAVRYVDHLDELGRIDRTSIKHKPLRPFWPTYWKRLALGFRITFCFDVAPNYISAPANVVTLVSMRRFYDWGA